MARNNDIGRLASSKSNLSPAEKEELLHALKFGPWRGPECVIRKLEKDVGAQSHVIRKRHIRVVRVLLPRGLDN
jgi:hypothetical protein